ncbi:M23 family metallopeptidase [Patescibacteria group bacterium]|nr:M23 family metallopeptidase [Patescibacteria group bacterium]
MHLRSRKKIGFKLLSLHKKKEPHAFHYLKQRASFLIAAFSLVAFVTGNMVGQHGWYAFWKSVMGKVDDSLIVYTGTVSPIDKVPDYTKWAQYGGNIQDHTFRQVPSEVLVSVPRYQSSIQRNVDALHGAGSSTYSVSYLGSYSSGAEGTGSHPAVDIRAPIGTPVRSIANGVVEKVDENGGFGKVVVIRHPNVPDPARPDKTTTLYSSYAHLSAIYVTEGTVVHKGEYIADSGQTGFASGPHLHFQIDREEAPWHPYWPFTGAEASREGMSLTEGVDRGLFQSRIYIYTVNPMLYVQANYTPVEMTIAKADVKEETNTNLITDTVKKVVMTVADRRAQRVARLQARRDERIRIRLARRQELDEVVVLNTEPQQIKVDEPEETKTHEPVIKSTETVASASNDPVEIESMLSSDVASIDIRHDREFTGREWEKLTLVLLDEKGNPVINPKNVSDIHLKAVYGSVEFNPPVVSQLDFSEGEAVVQMLPRGNRTVVIQAMPFSLISAPMRYMGGR